MGSGEVEFDAEVRAWIEAQGMDARGQSARVWGAGSDDVAVFDDVDDEEMARRLSAVAVWQRAKFDAGYATLSWDPEEGGRALPSRYQRRFHEIESEYEIPTAGELPVVSIGLIAPTIRRLGTSRQRDRFLAPLLRMSELACQLFSEPSAGSDLASVRTKAVADGDGWSITGQKVWTSGARFAQWGLAIARTDPTEQRHRGLTAFLVPLDAVGIDIRPIRQITGGTSFNEVFLDGVHVSDDLRLGEVGGGWEVALTVLAFERDRSMGESRAGGDFDQVLAAARHFGRTADPIVRDALADLFVHTRIEEHMNRRAASAARVGGRPGAEGSVSKLLWTRNMSRVSAVISSVLGPRLVADTGEWGTFAWTAHVLGAPGFRIAGGTDEIQRNIIGERVLGLPREPR
ncbi:acyl-CoA dehydrogenase family protein [Mycobacterium syngnathidarum]